MQMQPLSGKELDYISDCLSNEDMLIKLCACASAISKEPAIKQAISQQINAHQQHMNTLLNTLTSHQQLAPTTTH
ncbi:hypothetical protein ABE099_03005 [Paenibacillus turicensis]|uniref:hypothetical protein n=1 Tax=Paenibacillus turicensis TaxID=160487 RepID=UPI003D274117